MACSKYTLTNTGSTTINFSYQRCDDALWEYQVELLPNQTKNIWLINGTYTIAPSFKGDVLLVNNGVFPPVFPTPTPTNTPSSTPAVTPTPSATATASPTPSVTSTSSPTPTVTASPTPSVTATNTSTPTPTPTNTETPSPTPTATQTIFSYELGTDLMFQATACSNYPGGTEYFVGKLFENLTNGDFIYTDSGLSTIFSYDGFVSNGSYSAYYNSSSGGVQGTPGPC